MPEAERDGFDPRYRAAFWKWVLQSALGLVAYAVILFAAAGRLDWVWGWAWLAVLLTFMLAHPVLLARRDPALLAERSQGLRAPSVKRWDRWLVGASGIMMIAPWIVAGLDLRLGWTAAFPLAAHIAGLLLAIAGFSVFLWAMASNPFFSEGVRIQTDRGHVVARAGPYRFVRHPGYAGAILADLAVPFLLGSLPAVIPAVIFAVLYIVRTALEDRTLQQELPGYLEFAREIRFRLIPGLW